MARTNTNQATQGKTRGQQLAEAAAQQQRQAPPSQSQETQNKHDEAKEQASAGEPKQKMLYVIDTTAVPDRVSGDGQARIPGHREHEMIVNGNRKVVRFEHGKPTALPWPLAMKFLRHTEVFKLTDEHGNEMEFQATPRQPEDMQAGERFRIDDNEVVARLDELTTHALRVRCAMLPGGDDIAEKGTRDEIVKFIVERTVQMRVQRQSQEPDVGEDSFTPPPVDEDDFFNEAS